MNPARAELDRLRGGLVVSCQAPPESPFRAPTLMATMARAAVAGGAVGIRADGGDDVAAIRRAVDVPVVGIRKVSDGAGGVFITPSVASAREVLAVGCRLVALDGTTRERPGGERLAEVIGAIHAADAVALADVVTMADARHALASGADAIGTTLSGYTPDSPTSDEPDFALLAALIGFAPVPVFGEGRFWTPDQVGRAIDLGASFVVVGTAITNPVEITRRFVGAVSERRPVDCHTERSE